MNNKICDKIKDSIKENYKEYLIFSALLIFLVLFISNISITQNTEILVNSSENLSGETNIDKILINTTNSSETFLDPNGSIIMDCIYINGSAHQNCSIN